MTLVSSSRSLFRVGLCVMTLTATVLSWISQVVESPAAPQVQEHGSRHLNPITGLHRHLIQDLRRSLDTKKDLQLLYSEQPSQAPICQCSTLLLS